MTFKRSTLTSLSLLVLASYLLVSVFSLFHMAHMASAGMDMERCPYMLDQQSVCPMDIFAHTKSWHEFYSAPLSYLKVLSAVTLAFLPLLAIVLSPPVLAYRRRHTRIISLYQILFSSGILHPKAP